MSDPLRAILRPNEPLRTALDLLALLADSYPDADAPEPTILRAARNIAALRAHELYGAVAAEHLGDGS